MAKGQLLLIAMEGEKETARKLSNGITFNDLQ